MAHIWLQWRQASLFCLFPDVFRFTYVLNKHGDDDASSNTMAKEKKAELQVSLLITFATFSGHCHHSVYEPFSHFIFIAYTKATDHFNTELHERKWKAPLAWPPNYHLIMAIFPLVFSISKNIFIKESHCSWVLALRNVKYPPTRSLGSFLMILNSAMFA